MGFWSGVGSVIQGSVNLTGKGIRGVVGGVSAAAKGVAAGGAWCVRKTFQGTSVAVGWVSNDRTADIVENFGKTVGDVVEVNVAMVADTAEMGAGFATGLASAVVGDDDGADDANGSFHEALDHLTNTTENLKVNAAATAKAWTGEEKFEAVKEKYRMLERENQAEFAKLDRERSTVNARIMAEMARLNRDKQNVKGKFDRFCVIASSISDWVVARYSTFEMHHAVSVMPAPIKTKGELFADVDFDESPVWNRIKGTITGGILTVSQLKDVDDAIANQRLAAQENWERDQIETERLERVCEALVFVRQSFDDFLVFYDSAMDELEHSVRMIIQARIMQSPADFGTFDRINVYFLPKRHLNALIACDKLSRILCEMTKRRYLTDDTGLIEVIESDRNLVKKYVDGEFADMRRVLAA